jgi:protein gp37
MMRNLTPHLMWLLLTKRAQRYLRYLPPDGFQHDNVMLGATTENQEFYNVRMPHVIEAARELRYRRRPFDRSIPRVLTFASYEPALGPISFLDAPVRPLSSITYKPDWLIFGGETGHGRRPMSMAWAENIKDECEASRVAFWMKQMSAPTPTAAAALIPTELLTRNRPEVIR